MDSSTTRQSTQPGPNRRTTLPINFGLTPSGSDDASSSPQAVNRRGKRVRSSVPPVSFAGVEVFDPASLYNADTSWQSTSSRASVAPEYSCIEVVTDDPHNPTHPAVLGSAKQQIVRPAGYAPPDPHRLGADYEVYQPTFPMPAATNRLQRESGLHRRAHSDLGLIQGSEGQYDPSYLVPTEGLRRRSANTLTRKSSWSNSSAKSAAMSYIPVMAYNSHNTAGSVHHEQVANGISEEHRNGEPLGQVDVSLNFRARIGPAENSGYVLSKERMSSLSEIDKAKFGWFHFKVCLIAGIGFFTDAYDIFAINIATQMLLYVYGNPVQSQLTGAIKAAAPVGTLIGQLLFGYLGDRIGRKRMYGIELIIIIIGTFGQAMSANGDVGTINIFWILFVWRLIMGLGIGGDYPLSAVIASEFASTHIRGRMLTAVFANQGWGQLLSSVIGYLITIGFKHKYGDLSVVADGRVKRDIDQAWRILIGLGCVPAIIGLYFRLTIPETPRFTIDIERNLKQATEDINLFLTTGGYKYDPDSIVVRVVAAKATFSDFRKYFSRWDNMKMLFGCSYSWFAIDVIFYGLGLNTDKFFGDIGFSPLLNVTTSINGTINRNVTTLANGTLASNVTAEEVFRGFTNFCTANMLVSAVGLVPGYWVTFAVIDGVWWNGMPIGRKTIQLMGFGVLTVLFIAMGASYHHLISQPEMQATGLFAIRSGAKTFLALFVLASFFQNFGPNTTTFLIPGEAFPTRYRSTCHGLCAASGKAGAIISQFALQNIRDPRTILLSFVAFTFTGFLATWSIDETSQTSLEELSKEEQQNFIIGPVRPPDKDINMLRNHYLSDNAE